MSLSIVAITLAAATLPASGLPPPVATAPAALAGPVAIAVPAEPSAADRRDPAVLINLGIAHAQRGEDAQARAAFEAALAAKEVVELDTADGRVTDSRRLARKALKMLARGEFRPDAATAGRLTRRD